MKHLNALRKVALQLALGTIVLSGFAGIARAALCPTCAYVTGDNTVYSWDTSSGPNGTLNPVVTSQSGIDSLVFDFNHQIIFDVGNTGDILSADPNTGITSPVLSLGTGNDLGDMALEPSGTTILVAGRLSHKIYRVNPGAKSLVATFDMGGLRPDGIIYDNAGKLFAVLSSVDASNNPLANQSSVVQLSTSTGVTLNQINGLNLADGLTFNSTTSKLYVGASSPAGFYTIPSDLSQKTFTGLSNAAGPIDGVGTAGNFLYLIQYGDCSSGSCGKAFKYDLTGTQPVLTSAGINKADDIAPLSGLGSITPAPVLNSLSPNTAVAGSPTFTMTAIGSQFVNGAVVTWNGADLVTAFTDSSHLSATVPASDVQTAGSATVKVRNPDGQSSGPQTFTITASNSGGTLTRIDVTPKNPSVALNGTQQFQATAFDQNNTVMNVSFTWQLTTNSQNSVNQSGLFTGRAIGNDTVTAVSGSVSGNTSVTVTNTTPPPAPPQLARIDVAPLASVRKPGDTIPFTAKGYDQNGSEISGLNVSWSLVTTAGSTIDSSAGSYTAGTPASFPALDRIIATAGAIQGKATVTIVNSGDGLTIQSITAVPNPVHGTATQLTVVATTPNGTLSYQWDPSTYAYVSGNASQTVLNFSGPNTYNPQVTVRDGVHVPVSASIAVPVLQTITRIQVSPNGTTIRPLQSITFTKIVMDQWDQPMPNETVTWTSTGGSIDHAMGRFSSPVAQKTITVRATSITDSKVYGEAVVTVDGPPLSYDITGAYAYPVPWKSTMGIPNITFTGLATSTNIRIFTSTARLVTTLASINGENVYWNLTNNSGDRVASGVYYYFVENSVSNQKVKGKLVVIQ